MQRYCGYIRMYGPLTSWMKATGNGESHRVRHEAHLFAPPFLSFCSASAPMVVVVVVVVASPHARSFAREDTVR